jgi:hypothetical protein
MIRPTPHVALGLIAVAVVNATTEFETKKDGVYD